MYVYSLCALLGVLMRVRMRMPRIRITLLADDFFFEPLVLGSMGLIHR